MKVRGIDISAWQGDFDLARAKSEGIRFVIAKAGEGTGSKDKRFEANYAKAKQLGMPVGAYWFSRATTIEAALREADAFASTLRGKQLDLPVYMDVESKAQERLSSRDLTDVALAFCRRMQEHGFWVGIYSSLSWFRSQLIDSELQDYAHWVAQWSTSCSYPAGPTLGMWQYGGETNYINPNQVAGQVVDQNFMLVDYPSMIKAAGLNGFAKPFPFRDVPADHWCRESVRWAVEHGVTAGTSEGTFSPDRPCTRAEVLTMIWAMEGKADPASSYIPFRDVHEEDYFSKAVLWGVEKGVTAGVSPSEFAPSRTCSRAEVITMLYALAGKPEQLTIHTDLIGVGGPGDYYHQAMVWAYHNGITAGVGGGDLAPHDRLTRAQAVTMLYKFNQL